jgi:hypothetical protein
VANAGVYTCLRRDDGTRGALLNICVPGTRVTVSDTSCAFANAAPQEDQNLRGDARASIEHNILPSSRARRNEALMPFVEASYNCSAKNRNR